MSTTFSIDDADFDDLEDEEFLVEAYNFGTNQSKQDISVATQRKTGHDVSESVQNKFDKKTNDKLNSLRSFGPTGNPHVHCNNSMGKLRPSPINSKTVDDNYVYRNGKRGEHESISPEPPLKRHTSLVKDNFYLTPKEAKKSNTVINGVNNEAKFGKVSFNTCHEELIENSNRTDFHLMPNTSSRTTSALSGGLRYAQNTTAVVLSPSLIKNPDRSMHKSGDVEEQVQIQGLGNCKINPYDRTSPVKMPAYAVPSFPNSSNEYFEKDLLRNRCGNKTCSLVDKAGHGVYQNAESARCVNKLPTQVNNNSGMIDVRHPIPKTRRFPGPAGILPRLEPGQRLDNLPSPLTETPKKKSPEVCQMVNHNNDEEFSAEPWTAMQDEIRKRFSAPFDSLALVIRKAALQQLERGKVAFLGVLVKSFNPTGLDVSVVMKDPSGEMHGTLHRKVLEEHQVELGPGCGLFLKQVSVFSPSPRKHYLNITPGNIVEIFPACGSRVITSRKISELTPKRLPSQINRPELVTPEHTIQDVHLYKEDFEDLLEGLDADDDILAEAMNL